MSARCLATQARKPLRSADRMPLRFSVIILSIEKLRVPRQARGSIQAMSGDFRQDFIRFAVGENVLRFGEFRTKAGRISPYFFNAGLFNHGAALKQLAEFY